MLGRLGSRVRFDFRVDSAGHSELGLVRKENQDAWHADAEAACFVLADGMGGHAGGRIASTLAVQAVRDLVARRDADLRSFVTSPNLQTRRAVFDVMRAAAEHANKRVREEAARNSDWSGMGSTLDIVLLVRDRAFVLHVGDARVYLVRPGVTIQLTNDHDVRAALGVQSSIPPPARTAVPNRLLNAIGLGESFACDCVSFDVAPGDRLILCTDGVHQTVADEASLNGRGGTAATMAKSLIDGALAAGGRDNATAVVVDVREAIISRKAAPAPAPASRGALHHEPARDLDVTLTSPLLTSIERAVALRVLSAAVEVELPAGRIPRIVARDRVAYVVLEGEVARSDGTLLGPGAFLYAESLVDARRRATYDAVENVRAWRLRSDDFREVCAQDPRIAAALYERLARHLAHESR
jgi:serine/threonine protein phosphatase PrpC